MLKLVGLDSERYDLIEEPRASVLKAEQWGLMDEDGLYLIIDIGAGTLDLCIVRRQKKSHRLVDLTVLGYGGKHDLGGRRLDKDLADAILALYFFPANFAEE